MTDVNAYIKHAVAVACGVAIAQGILDPATGVIHLSGLAALGQVGIATGVSLILSYAGLGAPARNTDNAPDYPTNPDHKIS